MRKSLEDFAEARHTVARMSTYSGASVFESWSSRLCIPLKLVKGKLWTLRACLFTRILSVNLTSAGEKLPVNRAVFLLLFRKVSVLNRDLRTDWTAGEFCGLFSLSERKQDRSFDSLSSSSFTNHPIYFVTGNTGRSFNPLRSNGFVIHHQICESKILYPAYILNFCDAGSRNIQQWPAYTAITNWSLQRSRSLFTAWYEISLNWAVFHVNVLFKGLYQ